MIAFFGEKDLKDAAIKLVKGYTASGDVLRQVDFDSCWRVGWASGCTIHHGGYSKLETQYGIQQDIAYLEEGVYESASDEYAKTFPLRFMQAIPVGADLSKVTNQFFAWLLTDEEDGVIQYAKSDPERRAIGNVGALHARVADGHETRVEEWEDEIYNTRCGASGKYSRGMAWQAAASRTAMFASLATPEDSAQATAWLSASNYVSYESTAWAAMKSAGSAVASQAYLDAEGAALKAGDDFLEVTNAASRYAYINFMEKCGEKLLLLLADAPLGEQAEVSNS